MAKTIQINVDANYKGAGAIRQASADVKSLDTNAKQAGAGATGAFRSMLPVIAGVGAALGALALAAKGVWNALSEGAALVTLEQRFDKLATSIGSTADALLGKMREATQGMMSDMDMMSSASQIMSLRLADNEGQVVRLATVVGTLGWDMQQVILTFANMSTMRLDALGLSVEEVKTKAKELEAAGMSAQEAFKEAVILAGEARLDVGGVSDTEKAFKQLEAAIANSKSELSLFLIELATTIGLIDSLTESAARMGFERIAREAVEAGEITNRQWRNIIATMRDYDVAAAEIALNQTRHMNALSSADGGLVANIEAYRNWTGATRQSMIQAEAVTKRGTAALSEWTDEAKEAAIAAGQIASEFDGMDMAGIAGATQSGIWAAAGAHIQAILDEAQAAHDEAAAKIAEAYEEAARRMGQAFSGFLDDPKTLPNFGDMDSMNAMAFDMAQAFGMTVEQIGNIGIALGEVTPDMAEAAAKAVIFQEALSSLMGQFAAGNLDTSGFMAAYDGLIQEMQNKSLVEIQVQFKQMENPARELWAGLPMEERVKPVEVPVTFTPEQAALNTALGLIDGIPDEDTKIIKFDAEYAAVTPAATEAITTAINAIDGTVTFIPESGEVDAKIGVLNESRLTVYVDFVTGSTPEIPGRASGGRVERGNAYIVGEYRPELFIPDSNGRIVPSTGGRSGGSGLTINNYITGGDTATVERAMRRTADDVVRSWRRAGGSR